MLPGGQFWSTDHEKTDIHPRIQGVAFRGFKNHPDTFDESMALEGPSVLKTFKTSFVQVIV